MGVKIFRDDNWNRIRNGIISRRDIMRLDKEKDRELIGYLFFHAPETSRMSMMQYASDHYGVNEEPEPLKNTDDPRDAFFWEYAVLREQIMQEKDREVLKAAALHSSDYAAALFAFCRITGYALHPEKCDAYSYRTYECGILPDTTDADITDICQNIIKERGLLKDVAEVCKRNQKTEYQ